MKKISLLLSVSFLVFILIISCGGDKKTPTETEATQPSSQETAKDASAYDPKRGEGKHTAESLALSGKLNPALAEEGENIARVKCFSCHKTTDEKLVGPGWSNVTKRRAPEWIMNFITNPDPMIEKDPAVQSMLEICLVRMPNQNLSDEEARKILEFMFKNDGVK